jgi:hypothetical protein
MQKNEGKVEEAEEEDDFDLKFSLSQNFEKKAMCDKFAYIRRMRKNGNFKSQRSVRLPKNRKITKPPKNIRFDTSL